MPAHRPRSSDATRESETRCLGPCDTGRTHQRASRRSRRPCDPGHHEGDLIIGTDRSAIGTIVERTTGYTTLVHLPREQGWRQQPITKNGPALSGYGAVSMNRALAQALASMPTELKRSLTWDRGKGNVRTRPVHHRHRAEGLLRRPTQPHGNEVPTRTRMDYCANTFRRELISRDGAQTISRQSHTLSTRDHGNDSNGEPPLKPGTNTYDQFNSNVLLRPVEYALHPVIGVNHGSFERVHGWRWPSRARWSPARRFDWNRSTTPRPS